MAIVVCVLALCACTRELPPLQSTAVTGDVRVLSELRGRWYDCELVVFAEIRGGNPYRLSLRVPSGFTIAEARTVGDEIHFFVPEIERTLSLRRVADDVLVITPPGAEPPSGGLCGCGYELLKLSRWQLMMLKAQKVRQEVADAYLDVRSSLLGW